MSLVSAQPGSTALRSAKHPPQFSTEWIKLIYESEATPYYYKKNTAGARRGEDEKYILEYLKKFDSRPITLIDLGIGTGRELKDFEGLPHIKEIIGVDYSQTMLDFCRREWNGYKIPITYIKDDFSALEIAGEQIRRRPAPRVFALFYGTVNNTVPHARAKLLRTLKALMTPDDRLIIDFSKVPADQIVDFTHPWLTFKKPEAKRTFYDVQIYVYFEWLWQAIKKHFNAVPQFFYDEKSQNMTITIAGVGQCFFSHRYTESEIRRLYRDAGLRIEELIEGNEMYITVARL